jgi:hypothetical protein
MLEGTENEKEKLREVGDIEERVNGAEAEKKVEEMNEKYNVPTEGRNKLNRKE